MANRKILYLCALCIATMADAAKRDSLKYSILKLAKYLRTIDLNTVELCDLQVRKNSLETYWSRFNDIHETLVSQSDVNELATQQMEFDAVEKTFFESAADFTKLIMKFTTTSTAPKDSHTSKLQALEYLIKNIRTYAETDGATADAIHIQVQLKELDRIYLQFEQVALGTVGVRDNGYDDDATMSLLSTVQSEYRTAAALLLKHNSKFNDTKSKQQFTVHERDDNVKLPKLEPPTFDGNILGWESFRDLYTSIIHNREDLSAVRKFQYLKSCMKGSAESLVRNFALTNDNYVSAWQLLLDRYDSKKVLVTEHIRQLTSQPNCKESADEIKRLWNKTTESLRALENLKRPVQHWDDWIVFLVTQRLDSESRKLWEQAQCLNDNQPTWEDLQTFLQGRIRAVEATTLQKSSSSSSRNQAVKVHQVSASFSNCSFCSKSHRLVFCGKFRRKSNAEKIAFVKERQLCLNCLGEQHSVDSCPSHRTCNKCNHRHHSLLHFEQTDTASSTGSSLFTSPTNSTNSSSSLLANCHSPQILLPTVLVNVIQPSGAICTLRALLDQGSQASFITEEAARKLGLDKQNCNVNLSGIGSTSAGVAKHCVSFNCLSQYNSNNIVSVDALVLKKVTTLPRLSKPSNSTWDHLNELQLADPLYYRQDKIDLLLGALVYSSILLGEVIVGPPGTPIAQRTIFGWTLSGACGSSNAPKSLTVHHNQFSSITKFSNFMNSY